MSNNEEIAWAAGLFEGEGCFTAQKSYGGRKQARCILAMIDSETVYRFHEIVEVGTICTLKREKYGQRDLTQWAACGTEKFKYIFEMFKPYLSARRTARANEILSFNNLTDPRNQRGGRQKSGSLKDKQV